jgi:plastocyanin
VSCPVGGNHMGAVNIDGGESRVRITRWAGIAVAGATTAAMAVLPVTAAHAAAQTLSVQVGGDTAVSGVAFEGMRFDAPTVSVHKGDTLTFAFAGFHTATLLPVGETPNEWRAAHQAGLTSDHSLVVPDSDDNNGMLEFNPADFFPSDPTCGSASTPCAYDGKTLVNSGAPLASNSFTVTINDNPGDTFYVICLIHPGMSLAVNVVPDATAATTQAAIDSYKSSVLASDHEGAAALIPKLEKQTSHKTAGGATVWDAYAGFDQDGYGLDGMFPKTLHIKKGQTVRWHFTQLMGNIHTVTFPRSKAVQMNSSAFGYPICEGASGDTPPDMPAPPFCSSGAQNLELEVTPQSVLRSSGTSVSSATQFRSSGVEGAGAPSNASYDLKFTKASPKAGFKFACIVHGGMMSGAVHVS